MTVRAACGTLVDMAVSDSTQPSLSGPVHCRACGLFGDNPQYARALIMSTVAWLVVELLGVSSRGFAAAGLAGISQGVTLCAWMWWAVPGRSSRNPRLHYWGPVFFYMPMVLLALAWVGIWITGGEEGDTSQVLAGMGIAATMGLVPSFIAYRKGRDPLRWWMYGAAISVIALVHAIIMQPRGLMPRARPVRRVRPADPELELDL